MTTRERAEQRRLAQKERSKEEVACGRRGVRVGGEAAAAMSGTRTEESRASRVLFRCDMLLKEEWTKEGGARFSEWIGMTCDDPDDFQCLKDRVWSTETEFKAHDPVVLWRKDAPAPPA